MESSINNMSMDTEQNVTDLVFPTLDMNGVATGGKTIIRCASDGREVARFGYDASGNATFHQVISYDDETELEKIVLTFRPDGSLLQKSVSQFNQEGELTEITIIDPDGEIIDRQTYTYTRDHVHFSHFNVNQELIDSWTKRIR